MKDAVNQPVNALTNACVLNVTNVSSINNHISTVQSSQEQKRNKSAIELGQPQPSCMIMGLTTGEPKRRNRPVRGSRKVFALGLDYCQQQQQQTSLSHLFFLTARRWVLFGQRAAQSYLMIQSKIVQFLCLCDPLVTSVHPLAATILQLRAYLTLSTSIVSNKFVKYQVTYLRASFLCHSL